VPRTEPMGPRGATVEVVGLPGSGKTTLVRTIADAGADAGEHIVTTPLAGRGKAIAYARSAMALSPILLRGSSDRSRRPPHYGRMIRLDALRPERDRARRRVADAIVFDQGPVFLLSRLGPTGPDDHDDPAFRSWRDRMLGRWACALDLVIVLDAPDDILLQRISARSKHHVLKEAHPDAGRLTLQRHRQRFEEVLRELRGRGDFDLVRLDTADLSTEAAATCVAEAAARASRG